MAEEYLSGADGAAGAGQPSEDDLDADGATEAPHEHAAGLLGDEAVRAVSAVTDWARRAFPESTSEHRNDCTWCPLCQFLAVLRGERPEVTERVAEAGTALVSALRAFVDATGIADSAPGAHRHPSEQRHADEQRNAQPRPRVERIDLGDMSAGQA